MKLSEFIEQAQWLVEPDRDPEVRVKAEGEECDVDCVEQDCKTGVVYVALV